MNKILKGSIVLMVFSFTISIFQMSCTDDVIAQAMDYILPVATPSILGGVKPDGTTILVDATGKISTAGTTALPIATTTTLGGVKPDGTTITVDGTGKLSSVGLQQQHKILFTLQDSRTGIAELWYVNYDGSGKTQIPLVNLPHTTNYVYVSSSISPDGQSVFIVISDNSTPGNSYALYSMSTTGTNVKKIVDIPTTAELTFPTKTLQAY